MPCPGPHALHLELADMKPVMQGKAGQYPIARLARTRTFPGRYVLGLGWENVNENLLLQKGYLFDYYESFTHALRFI